MEQIVEGTIDRGLESIASGLYIFSIVFGIALVLMGGVLLLFKNKDPKKKKNIANIGLVCLVIGVVAIISGLIQMK